MDGVFYINKPMGMTSFDVVAKMRKRIKQKSIGHTGTLDPNAEGLLILLVGKACKILPYCEHNKKEYIASLKLGIMSDTADIWGNIIEKKEIEKFSIEQLENVLKSFVRKQLQIPPMTSAIKVNGKKLLEYQREGIEINRKPREIEIYELELLHLNDDVITFRAVVSKGTYIRVLCEDIAKKLNNIATMCKLVRTAIGDISLDNAAKIDDINELSKPHDITEVLKGDLKMVEYEDLNTIKHGKKINLDCSDDLVLITNCGKVVAAYEREYQSNFRCKRGLW
ncbi:MAG: tRNA pseudouridine(55) synthase TruB [Anaerorhabdus sp.]